MGTTEKVKLDEDMIMVKNQNHFWHASFAALHFSFHYPRFRGFRSQKCKVLLRRYEACLIFDSNADLTGIDHTDPLK